MAFQHSSRRLFLRTSSSSPPPCYRCYGYYKIHQPLTAIRISSSQGSVYYSTRRHASNLNRPHHAGLSMVNVSSRLRPAVALPLIISMVSPPPPPILAASSVRTLITITNNISDSLKKNEIIPDGKCFQVFLVQFLLQSIGQLFFFWWQLNSNNALQFWALSRHLGKSIATVHQWPVCQLAFG